jgi:hypothetical protein
VKPPIRTALFALLAVMPAACWLTASLDAPADGGGVADTSRPSMEGGHDAKTDAPREDGAGDGARDVGRDAVLDARHDSPKPQDAAQDRAANDASVTCLTATTYAESVMAAGPVAYWRLGDALGSPALDQTSNHHNGAYASTGVMYQQAGPPSLVGSSSVLLDGNRGEVLVDGGFSEFVGNVPYTLEAWIDPSDVTPAFAGILSNEHVTDAGAKSGYVMYVQVEAGIGLDRYGTGASTPLDTAGQVTTAAWQHVAGTYNPAADGGGALVELYVNGSLVDHHATALMITPACVFAIGATHCGTTGFFNGKLAEVALYPAVLDGLCIHRHANFPAQ